MTSSFSERKIAYRKNKTDRDSGKLNCIPFYKAFPRLSKHIPGLIKGVQYKILSYTGIGKTKFAKFLGVFLPAMTLDHYPDCGITYKVFFFLLEETIDEAIDSITVSILSMYYNTHIDVLELKSMYEESVSSDILDIVESEEFEQRVDKILKCVEFIDTITNPFGIYKKVRSYMKDNGHFSKKTITTSDGKEVEVDDKYIENDPDHYVIFITDHVGLMTKENTMSKHETIGKYSHEYCRRQLVGKYYCININVQQMEMKGDDVTHFKAGRLEPSLDKAATNKEILRDDMVILGLFAPDRYRLTNYIGYDIVHPKDEYKSLRDNFRSVHVLKNRIGTPNSIIPMFFDGASGQFKELPKTTDTEGLKKVYSYLKKIKSVT